VTVHSSTKKQWQQTNDTNLYLKTGLKFLWSIWKIFNGQDLLTEWFYVALQKCIYMWATWEFPRELGFACCPNFRDNCHRQFYSRDQTSFLSTNQHRQSTERNSKHWLKPGNIIHWPHPFFIHSWTFKKMVLMLLALEENVCKAHSICGLKMWITGKTVWSLISTFHTYLIKTELCLQNLLSTPTVPRNSNKKAQCSPCVASWWGRHVWDWSQSKHPCRCQQSRTQHVQCWTVSSQPPPLGHTTAAYTIKFTNHSIGPQTAGP